MFRVKRPLEFLFIICQEAKKTVEFLHSFGLSISYECVLRTETQLAESVLRNMQDNGGFFISSNFLKGRHVFFAVDNIDSVTIFIYSASASGAVHDSIR